MCFLRVCSCGKMSQIFSLAPLALVYFASHVFLARRGGGGGGRRVGRWQNRQFTGFVLCTCRKRCLLCTLLQTPSIGTFPCRLAMNGFIRFSATQAGRTTLRNYKVSSYRCPISSEETHDPTLKVWEVKGHVFCPCAHKHAQVVFESVTKALQYIPSIMSSGSFLGTAAM